MSGIKDGIRELLPTIDDIGWPVIQDISKQLCSVLATAVEEL